MKKFIPYEKLSKKEKRRLDAARRGSWGGLNPVTRKPMNPKAYKRDKAWKREVPPFRALFFAFPRGEGGAKRRMRGDDCQTKHDHISRNYLAFCG